MTREQRDQKVCRLAREGMTYAEIAAEMRIGKSTVGDIIKRGGSAGESKRVASAVAKPVRGGFDLKESHRISAHKPSVSPARLMIRALEPGKGFTSQELADQSGMSPDTIENAAKRMGCRLAVEVEPDNWVFMIMEPGTAKKFKK